MSERTEYAPGEFCWVDLSSTDIDAGKRFYGELLGVEAEAAPGGPEVTGGYGFFTKNGKQVAGFGPTMQDGQASAWSSYVNVENADDTAEKVRGAGGQVLFEPMDLPNDSGRMAVCQDPTGAVFSIMQQDQHTGAELVNESGTWTWNNLMTRDLQGAKDFYGQVFGWEATHSEEAPSNVLMWQVKGQRWPEGLGGLMGIGTDLPAEMPAHWQVYFTVEDADGSIEQAKQMGGQLAFGPLDVPVGRLAVLVDPQGAPVAIFESHYPEPR
jgi:predicted enzyme related to lactoylglutathione lyase